MRQSICILLLGLLLCACGSSSQKWEYTILSYQGSIIPQTSSTEDLVEQLSNADYNTASIKPLNFPSEAAISDRLNVCGKDGWELVDTYTTVETAYPNFGNEDYHTGIKTNTRTLTINFVFKRPKK